MRLILHAGLHKTGSTSLQAYLNDVRGEMARSGVIYPDFGAENHWRVAAELMARDERAVAEREIGYLGKLMAEQGAEGTLDALAALIREHSASDGVLLVSHENFGVRARLAALARFVASIDPDLRMTVLAYCREPAALYRSTVQHNVRGGASYPQIDGWISPHVRRIRNLRAVKGVDLKLRCFSRHVLAGGDVIEDFRQWFAAETGRALPIAARSFSENVALSAEGCALLLEIAADATSPFHAVPGLGEIVFAFDAGWPKRTALTLPRFLSRAVRGANAVEWNQLVDSLDHPEEVRSSLRIAAAKEPISKVWPRAIERWLRAGAAPEYRAAFEASGPGKRLAAAAK